MKTFTLRFSVVSVLLLTAISCFSQKHDTEKLLTVAREVIESAGVVALITLDDEGRPRVRAMDPFPPENDFSVWLATVPGSRKVAQIKGNPNVTLYYLSESKSGYVMIRGLAELVDSPTAKERYWKESWEEFYPNYPEGFLLIKVNPITLEVISGDHGIVGDEKTWQPPIVEFEEN